MYYEERKETVPEAPVKLEPWQENLLKAAQYIRDHGWCQHRLENRAGNVCLVGAIKRAMLISLTGPACGQIFKEISAFLGTMDLGHWNDDPKRSKEEVIAALEGAAKRGG